MNSINRIISTMERGFEAIAKARMNSVLLGMGRDKVEEFGYSWELLQTGPSAWPWRKPTQDSATPGSSPAQTYPPEKFDLRQNDRPSTAVNSVDPGPRYVDTRADHDQDAA